ncbi:MAG: hypothetical protein IPL31_04725 [Saprospiraceae bacterium]|nr:hypothetical protein [Saprospiraceae bacterium]
MMAYDGTDIELTNRSPRYSDQSSRWIDQRIIGKWTGGKTISSYGGLGNASITSENAYLFRLDGTYESLDAYGKYEKGVYFILNDISANSLMLRMGERNELFNFYENNNKMRDLFGNWFTKN